MTVYINLVGNPSTGFTPIGPFDFGGDAFDAGEEYDYKETQWVMELVTNHPQKWTNPLVQFARLICEVEAAGGFSDGRSIIEDLCTSMDCEVAVVMDIIERANSVWEEAKVNV